MKRLILERIALRKGYTIGKLYYYSDTEAKQYVCDTLEDEYRGQDLTDTKIKGQTCIPYGTYGGKFTMSSRFRKVMPLLINVPFFLGIRIHSGNKPEDTEGCILVGENKVKGQVLNSRKAYEKLMSLLKNQPFTITIK